MGNEMVLWDPKGEYWEGALIEESPLLERARRAGVHTIPADTALMRAGGGVAKKAWGAGWRPQPNHPGFLCPIPMFVALGNTRVVWRAGLVLDAKKDEEIKGDLRLCGYGQMRAAAGAPMIDSHSNLALVDLTGKVHDGKTIVVIGGEGSLACAIDGWYAFALYGKGAGFRVAWAAVSQIG